MSVQKLHPHLLSAIEDILFEVFSENKYADKTIEKSFKNHRKWGSRDRKFVAETVYEVVRWKRLYSAIRGESYADWLQAHLTKEEWSPQVSESLSRAVRESIPDWLDQLGESQFGAQWDSILKSLNRKSEVDLRVNTLRAQPAQVLKSLQEEGYSVSQLSEQPETLVLNERKNVFTSEAFKKGFFEVQDRASQKVGHFLGPLGGERVIDACAGAGGKSLHLAALMHNRGKIISLDIHEWKLKELRARASRAGANIIEARVIDSTKVIKRLHDSADRVLLDVPCSGLGVLRRNPDTKWKLTPAEIERLIELQRDILDRYCLMLKPGGVMVYSTCSFLKSENEEQVEGFLDQHSQFELLDVLRINPDQGLGDGFFAAKFQHKG